VRITSLDAVRGIAALLVVIAHCIGTNPTRPPWSVAFPLSLLDAGDGAVIVFFALSGCVLFLSLEHQTRFSYRAYVIRRVFRIYPAFVVSILGSAALCALVQPHDVSGVSAWFNAHWQSPPTAAMIAGHLAMTDLSRLRQLDSVMWSLVHELRISFVFPLITLCVIRNWRLAIAASTLISVACVVFERHHPISWAFDLVGTLSYVFLFAAGAALAQHAHVVRHTLRRAPLWLQIVLWIVALRLVTVPVEQYDMLATAVGALMIIALAFGVPATDRLLSTNAFCLWLGRVSYSLYLVHFPILLSCVHLFHAQLPLPAIFVVTITLSLAVADVMNRLVEKPAISLGRRLAAFVAAPGTSAPRPTFGVADLP
jgi:peptidoglycan/LPS O-acetylase OafA/YrhL